MKICVLGCGLRTPLLLHGLVNSGIPLTEIALYDNDPSQAELMAEVGKGLSGVGGICIVPVPVIENAIGDSGFVISSIRVGNMQTRATDERIALECGFAGQETTGPAGFAMALRTIPVALEQARMVARIAPSAWIVNFTNPAGIVTQAISTRTRAKVVGICDTPAELFHQIARALREPPEDVHCDYFGLNHLGWVRSVRVRGVDMTERLIENETLLRQLYSAELFPLPLIRELRMIPTEYLFFYYNQTLARDNQLRAGATRGEELNVLNLRVHAELERCVEAGDVAAALTAYRRYLNRRNASYMRLDGAGQSAFEGEDPAWDPFEGATGYHRIAVEAIRALMSARPHTMVLNVPNRETITGLRPDDVVEVPCVVDESGPLPLAVGNPPDLVRGLMASVKQYERLTIAAAVQERWDLAVFALTMNPIVGSWDAARQFLDRLSAADRGYYSSFERNDILR
jgi:6-phospho-beta-glucosidase